MTRILRYLPGERASIDGRPCTIERVVSLTHVLVKEDESGAIVKAHFSQLKSFVPPDSKPRRDRPMDSLTEEEKKIVAERYEAIKPLLTLSGPAKAAFEKRSEETGYSGPTLYRWISLYKEREMLSDLAPRRRGRKMPRRTNRMVEVIIQRAIDEAYLTYQKPLRSDMIRKIRSECRRAKLPPPHPNTIRSRIKAMNKKKAMERREGAKAARDKFGPVTGSFPHAEYPLAVVEIDHTELDMTLVDDRYRLDIGRPWFTLAIDVYSRMIVGYYLSLEKPSAFSVGQCIAHAVLQKYAYLQKLGIEGDWPVWGKMATLHADNGKDFRSRTIMAACEEHGINIEWRPVDKPEWGGNIERLMGTLATELHRLPGTTFSNVRQKGTYDSAKRAVLTLGELERCLATWVVNDYHHRKHEGIGMAPIEKWEIGLRGSNGRVGLGTPALIADEERLRVDFLPYTVRTVQRHGIEWDRVRYFSKELVRYIDFGPRKRKFKVRRDPRDISVIKFLDPERNEYIDIPCGHGYPSTSIWEFRAAVNYLKRQGNRSPEEYEIFAEVGRQQIDAIVEEAAKTTRKARRLHQRRKAWRNGDGVDPQARDAAVPRIVINDDEAFDLTEDDLKPTHEEWT